MVRCWAGVVAVVATVTAGCNQIFGLVPADRTVDAAVDADESLIDAGLGKWDTPLPIGAFSTTNDEQDPAITSDGLELYSAYTPPASPTLTDIVRSRRVATNQSWPPPVVVMELRSNMNEMTPRITDNDRVIYFASGRPAGVGGVDDIWMSLRASNLVAWSIPAVVQDLELNSAASDRSASPCLGATRFIFTSDRVGGQADLYELASGVATPIPVASSPAFTENGPFVTEDCLTVYFSWNLTGNADLYVMSRETISDDFGMPERIDELSSEPAGEGDPWVSADGRHIVFSTNRDGTFDLYEAFR